MATQSRKQRRVMRKDRVRKTVKGTDVRPRLCVFRSLQFTYAQLISDETNQVLCSVNSKELGAKKAKNSEAAKEVGKKIAALAKEKNITAVTFNRNGYLYHGRVKAVAEGAREAGLEF